MMKIVVKIVPYSMYVHTDTPKFYTIHSKPVIPNQGAVAYKGTLKVEMVPGLQPTVGFSGISSQTYKYLQIRVSQ